MTKIYFVRHCEGEGNAVRRSQTVYDGLITTKGLQQCYALRDRFRDIPLDAVYSSDAYRARVAADIVAQDHGLQPRYRKLLREYNVGLWDGMANGDARRDFAKYLKHNDEYPGETYFPGGDTYESIARRAAMILQQLLEDHKDQTILVVSHAYMLQVTLCCAMRYPPEEIGRISYGDNTAVTLLIDDNGQRRLEFMADISHLPEELKRQFTLADREGIDMPTERLTLPEDRERLMKLDSLLRKSRRKEPLGEDDCVKEAAERCRQNRDYVAFFMHKGEAAGLVYMSKNETLSDEYAFLEDWYMSEDLRHLERDLQMLGHAIHTARKENKRYLAVRKSADTLDQKMLGRFFFEEIPGREDMLRLDVIPPMCTHPVV